jgi:hypothetical protein
MVLEDVRGLEAVGEHQGLVGKEVGSRPIGDDDAMVDEDFARAKLDDELEIVRGDDLCRRDCAQQLSFAKTSSAP